MLANARAATVNKVERFVLDELTALARLDIEQGRVEEGLGKLKAILANPAALLRR